MLKKKKKAIAKALSGVPGRKSNKRERKGGGRGEDDAWVAYAASIEAPCGNI